MITPILLVIHTKDYILMDESKIEISVHVNSFISNRASYLENLFKDHKIRFIDITGKGQCNNIQKYRDAPYTVEGISY